MKKLNVVLLLIFSLFAGGCGYNTLQSADEQIKASWAEVVNQYQRRADLIPNLVETVKGFAAQEKDVLLGVTSARRSPLLPDVPAIAETPGMQKYEINGWLGVVAPAGTPPAVIELLSNRIGEILRRPDIRERFETSMAITAVDEGPESFRRFIAVEVERWRTVVKLANATVD